ncbi:C45 family autoproteolytic acyltransferase/hydolase [Paraburkholderia phosphatilytica]|uniref:C45 family autoproteolytic acyltransferase/hydolase n=1 Tax=Paraburkholderia phosphatilytica TaxID=2282883 RepID=UPI000E4F1316|nr:C45 family peptidase [Paraburkholderia phosphatilytica]
MSEPSIDAVRRDHAGWIYVHIEGEPYDRGEQHGQLLATEIRNAIHTARYLAKWDTGEDFDTFVNAAVAQFAPKLDTEFADEIQGIADGAKLSFAEVLAWNGYMDLLQSWWPSHASSKEPRLGTKPWRGRRGHHCSAFVATGSATRDGRIVMAHNSWDRYAAGDAFNVVFDIVPDNGHRILMQGLPGCISSLTDFWVTGGGLMVTETTISNFVGYNPAGAPEFYRSRRATQYANSIGEWCEMFAIANNGGYANSWLLGDVKTGEIARYELGLHFSGFESTKDGFYSGYNTATDLKIRNQECVGEGEDYTDVRKNGARRLRFMQLAELHHGKIDMDVAKEMIADHHDVYLDRADNPCSRTICGHLELDDARFGGSDQGPFNPWGANDGKVVDSEMARNLSFWARWGHPCGRPFDAQAFMKRHPQWNWLNGYMRDRPSWPWTRFEALR